MLQRTLNGAEPWRWNTWTPLQLPYTRDLRAASFDEAHDIHETLMNNAEPRIAALCELFAWNGIQLNPTAQCDDAELADETLATFGITRAGLEIDLALWLGTGIIAARRDSATRWELYRRGRRTTGYNRTVLVGFPTQPTGYYVDVAFFVSSWLESVRRGRGAQPHFLKKLHQITCRT